MEEYPNKKEQEDQHDPVPARRVLRLSELVYTLKKRLILIVVCAMIGLAVGIALSVASCLRGDMSKQYAVTASIAVTSQDENGLFTAQSGSPNANDIYLAQSMVDAVMYVMKSDRTLNAAIEQLSLPGISTRDISRNLRMSQYNDTQIIELTLYWRSASEGVEILKAINALAPDILVSTLKIGNVSVINEPTARYLLGGSLNAMRWIYLAALGAMLGVGFALLELLLRPTLLKTEDMEQRCHVQVLGELPNRSGYFRKKRNLLLTSQDEEVQEMLDYYVSLAHILKARLSKQEHPCVYITSAARNEGRTTLCAYLAVQLAEIGMKVLAVDFDIRNPKLGGLFLSRVDDAHSVNAIYRGDSTGEEAITHLTANLDLLPSVPERMPLPLDEPLLNSISDLKQDYDIVLMDTAPVGLAVDTMSLNRLADAALLVVRFDGASMEIIQDALGRLDKSGMSVLGCVVNCVNNPATASGCRSDRTRRGKTRPDKPGQGKRDREA